MRDDTMKSVRGNAIDNLAPGKPITGDEVPFSPVEIERLRSRRWILNYAAKNAVGTEIGVFRGHFSEVLAAVLHPRKLYLVDPWRRLGPDFGWGAQSPYTAFGKLTTEYAYRDTLRRVSRFKEIDTRVFEGFAEEFFSALEEKLDWVYLDASHEYPATLNELKLIDAVLKPTGVIMGDDWQPGRHHKHHGVFRAVHEFVRTHPYEIVAAGPAGQWCLRKSPRSDGKATRTETGLRVISHAPEIPWVLYAAIDSLPVRLEGGQAITISGVVVLAESAPTGYALFLQGTGRREAQWNLRSPVMEKRFPGGLNSAYARFRFERVSFQDKGSHHVLLADRHGNEFLLFRLETIPDVV